MPCLTRSNRKIMDQIKKTLNEFSKLNKQGRIKITHHLFNEILLTQEGMNLINKQEKFKKTVRNKLEEFYGEPEVREHAIEWHMKIFKEPIWQEKEEARKNAMVKEIEDDLRKQKEANEAMRREQELRESCGTPKANQEEEYDIQSCSGYNYFEKWAEDIAESSTLTRQRKKFLREIWEILRDIDNSQTMYDATSYNEELYDVLTTKYGQNMLEQFPRFTSEMENEIYWQYSEGRIVEWEDHWYDVFGTSIHSEMY